jgi:hypothetical protein
MPNIAQLPSPHNSVAVINNVYDKEHMYYNNRIGILWPEGW